MQKSLHSHVMKPRFTPNWPREALHGRMGDLTDSAYAMATLFALDRHFAIDDLNAPGVVLLDRYVASNAAYTAARLLDDDAPAGLPTWNSGGLGSHVRRFKCCWIPPRR